MSIIGSSWSDEPSPEEQYKEITGEDFYGDSRELRKQIERKIGDGYTSKTERNKLRDLLNNQDL